MNPSATRAGIGAGAANPIPATPGTCFPLGWGGLAERDGDLPRDSKPPAFQFYPADFLSDANVACMSLAAQGAYVRLLCHCWLQGKLPKDPKKLAALAGSNGRGEWPNLWEQIKPCFRSNGRGSYVHPRLVREREKQIAWRAKSKSGGIASGKSRKSKDLAKGGSTKQQPHGSRVVQPNTNTSSSSSSSSSRSLRSLESARDDRVDQDFQSFWAAWPDKIDEIAAQRSFLSAVEDIPPIGELVSTVKAWSKTRRWREGYVPKASTWIDHRRWRDQLPNDPEDDLEGWTVVRR